MGHKLNKLNKIEKQIYSQFVYRMCFEIEGTENDVIYYLHIDQCMRIKSPYDRLTPNDTIITYKFDKPDNWDDMLIPYEWENMGCSEFVHMIKDLASIYEEMVKENEGNEEE